MSKERAIHNIIWNRWWNVLYPWVIKMKEKEKNYRYWKEKSECRYRLAINSCSRCLFENLCLFEQNQERLCKDTHETEKIS